MTAIVPVKTKSDASAYEVRIGAGLLSSCGDWAAESLGISSTKICIISNKKVFRLYGSTVIASLRRTGFHPFVHLIADGEHAKSFRSLEKTLKFFGESALSRTDSVLALGGGVVGDLAGFAASIYLRGVSYLQVPTTLLSMIDSSVGGKTGINTAFGKNLVGSFYQPKGVMIDPEVLTTLPTRERTAGFCEAVKQGAISGSKLLNATSAVLTQKPEYDSQVFSDFLVAQIRFKSSIVAADERESPDKQDAKSRKILNFGHTFAHALEKVTDFSYLRHGEAVGWGIIFAAKLSKKLELLSSDEVELLNGVVHRAGVLPPIGHIDPSGIFEAFKYDKKNIANSLHWILLKGIGKPVIVPQSKIPSSLLRSTIREVVRP